MKNYLTQREAAQAVGVSLSTFKRMRASGTAPAPSLHVGKSPRWTTEDAAAAATPRPARVCGRGDRLHLDVMASGVAEDVLHLLRRIHVARFLVGCAVDVAALGGSAPRGCDVAEVQMWAQRIGAAAGLEAVEAGPEHGWALQEVPSPLSVELRDLDAHGLLMAACVALAQVAGSPTARQTLASLRQPGRAAIMRALEGLKEEITRLTAE